MNGRLLNFSKELLKFQENEFSIRLALIFEKIYPHENFYNSKQTAYFQGETLRPYDIPVSNKNFKQPCTQMPVKIPRD
jgi:hypothetical protein